MTVFTLKIIAMISMVLDHIKYAIPQTRCFATEYLGRIAFPIFAFLISEGFLHTHSKTKYILRMLIFAIISQIPFYFFSNNLVHSNVNFNVLFTFEIALIGLCIIDFFRKYEGIKLFNYTLISIALIIILIFTYYIHPDYTWYGVMCVWIFYIFRNNKILLSLNFIILNIAYYFIKVETLYSYKVYLSMFFSLLPLVFILLYNGQQGKRIKYLFYVFYPLQFIVLYGINYFFIK